MTWQPPRDEVFPWFERLWDEYKRYCLTVSVRWMALSIETTAYAWWLCEQTQARRVVDLGSGFSSYMLRLYQQDHPDVEVMSVDDNPEWLAKTEKWLARHDLPTDGLVTPDEFLQSDGWDVVIYDYSGGEIRDAMMEPTVARAAADGFVIFDDAQAIVHHLMAVDACRRHGMALFSLVEQTMDDVGRHAVLGHRVGP